MTPTTPDELAVAEKRGYETGYRDGGNSTAFDLTTLLEGLEGVDHLEHESPWDAVRAMHAELVTLRASVALAKLHPTDQVRAMANAMHDYFEQRKRFNAGEMAEIAYSALSQPSATVSLHELEQVLAERNILRVAESTLRAENERLRLCLNPRKWPQEMMDAWHRAIPDLQKAFEKLHEAALSHPRKDS